jgi:FeS assembly SUF system regulator
MRLTRQADYGILLLAEIASGEEGAIHAAPELAAATGMPASMVAKTLKHLARQGLLDSTRGARGGYRLARPAKAISLADVVMAFEGPIAMTQCTDGAAAECGIESRCRVHHNWLKLNRVVIGALARVNLAEMIAAEPPRLVLLDELAQASSRGDR